MRLDVDVSGYSDVALTLINRIINEARFPLEFRDPLVGGSLPLMEFHCLVVDEIRRRPDSSREKRLRFGVPDWWVWSPRSDLHVSLLNRCAADVGKRRYFLEHGADAVVNFVRPYEMNAEIAQTVVDLCEELEHRVTADGEL